MLKLTKNELRLQEKKLSQLERYLPTLQLKKSLLQIEVNQVEILLAETERKWKEKREEVEAFSGFFKEKVEASLTDAATVIHVDKEYENIAGVEAPILEKVFFAEEELFFFETPIWFDSALEKTKEMVTKKEEKEVVKEKLRALQKELREVSIRVNLFEKVLIPQAKNSIKKIRIFLGDQFLTAVSQAKVAKEKIEKKRAMA